MSKHTPGPWKAAHFTDGSQVYAPGADNRNVALSVPNRADAELMAAAPAMLEALEQLAEEYFEDALGGEYRGCGCEDDDPENRCGLCAAHAAIVRAKGGSRAI